MITTQTYINTAENKDILAVSLVTFIDGMPSKSKNIILNKLTTKQINQIKDFNNFIATLPND